MVGNTSFRILYDIQFYRVLKRTEVVESAPVTICCAQPYSYIVVAEQRLRLVHILCISVLKHPTRFLAISSRIYRSMALSALFYLSILLPLPPLRCVSGKAYNLQPAI